MESQAMKIVSRHCSGLMKGYSECVEKYPSEWHSACASQRHELARCSETHPVMLEVKSKCNSLFRQYEKCQRLHLEDASHCREPFGAFLDCVETVASHGSPS